MTPGISQLNAYKEKNYSDFQFSFFRLIFGIYLIVHAASLLPYSAELFSRSGMIKNASLNVTFAYFPNLLNTMDSAQCVFWFIAGLIALSFLYLIGLYRRAVSLLLWYGLACLFNRNNLITNPSLPYVGWLLLASAVIPSGEPASADAYRIRKTWEMPSVIYGGAWVLLALGYLASAYAKLKSPSWIDGSAVLHVLQHPMARDYALTHWMLTWSPTALKIVSWIILSGELLFVPLCLWRPTRFLAWLWTVAIHLCMLAVVRFGDLTFGMLVFHLFIYDRRWPNDLMQLLILIIPTQEPPQKPKDGSLLPAGPFQS